MNIKNVMTNSNITCIFILADQIAGSFTQLQVFHLRVNPYAFFIE